MGACRLVKKAIAAPVQIIEHLKFIFSFINKPRDSCVPPPIFIKIILGFFFFIIFIKFLS